MKKKSKKATTKSAPSKKKPLTSLNPAENSLTNAEYDVYQIVRHRQVNRETITSGDVAAYWGNKNRSYTYRVLKSLIAKGLIEQYSQRYYRLATTKGN